MSKSKKFVNSFERSKPTIRPHKVGLELLDVNIKTPIKYFNYNLEKIYDILNNTVEDELEQQESYRYCIILICGALDKYIHDIVKTMLLLIFNRKINPGRNFDDFLIPISLLKSFDETDFDSSEKERILNKAIYEKTSSLTMQKSHAIERNLYYVLSINIWKAVLPKMKSNFKEIDSSNQLKKAIDKLTDRRNKIAHELDYIPNTGERTEISYTYTKRQIYFVTTFIKTLNDQIRIQTM